MKKTRGIHLFFADDPERADWDTWGRRSDPTTRRGFVKGLGAFTALVGARVAFPIKYQQA